MNTFLLLVHSITQIVSSLFIHLQTLIQLALKSQSSTSSRCCNILNNTCRVLHCHLSPCIFSHLHPVLRSQRSQKMNGGSIICSCTFLTLLACQTKTQQTTPPESAKPEKLHIPSQHVDDDGCGRIRGRENGLCAGLSFIQKSATTEEWTEVGFRGTSIVVVPV